MKNETENLLLEIAIQNKEIIYKDNKTLAKVDFLKLWEKNPKITEEKDLKRLKEQIKELNVYKPLVVALGQKHGLVLGGNQRLKVLQELAKEDEKYQYVWISLVEAPDDIMKLKYALSDNEQIGKYTREGLTKVLKPFMEQPSLLKDYNIEITDRKSMNKFMDELAMTEKELKIKQIKKDLKAMGIIDETINMVTDMINFNKINEKLEDVGIQGEIKNQRYPMCFWFTDIDEFNKYREIYKTHKINIYDTDKLKENTKL